LNLPPRVTFTAGLREKMHAAAQAAAAAATAAAAQAAAVANPSSGVIAGSQGKLRVICPSFVLRIAAFGPFRLLLCIH